MTAQSEVNPSQAQEKVSAGSERIVGEAARGAYVSSAVEQTGKILRTLSDKVRSVAESLREQSGPSQRVGKTVERVANKLESSANYLTRSQPEEIRGDLSDMVRRYPLRSLGIFFGVGLVLGSVLRRRGV